MRRIGLAIVVVGALLLALPAVAGAALQIRVSEDTLTVTGTDEPDAITLSVGPQDKIAVNGEETALARGAAAEIEVTGGGGSDVVDAQALLASDYGSMEIHGGADPDALTGGRGEEVLFGDAGGDLLRGTPGNDFLDGGAGDDEFTWNNGDNNDEVVGGVGDDSLGLSGHPTAADNLSFRPSLLQSGWVLIKRQETAAAKAFAMELLDVETLAIETLGGDDFTANDGPAGIGDLLANLIIHGGEGADQIGGSNGDDALDGGPGDDLVVGAAGDDLLGGSSGDDRLVGEAGDDRMIWTNGDNNDEDIGGLGDDEVVLSGHPTEPDLLFFKPSQIQPGWVSLQREEAGSVKAFTIELLEVEDFLVETLGGRDFVAQEGPQGIGALTRLHLQGGAGDDQLGGSDGNEQIEGGDGADLFFARDGKADLVVGGPGEDEAFTDLLSIDDVREVESVIAAPAPEQPGPEEPGPKQPDPETPSMPERPAPPAPSAPDDVALLPSLGKLSIVQAGKSPVVTVPLACPATEAGGCRTTVTVQTAKAVRVGGRRAILRLGSALVDLPPGAMATAKVRLNRRAATLLGRAKLPVRVRIASSDAAGNAASSSLIRVLKPR